MLRQNFVIIANLIFIEADTKWPLFRWHFKVHFLDRKILNEILLKYVAKGPADNMASLVHVMAWCQIGYKPLSEAMLCFTNAYMRHWASTEHVKPLKSKLFFARKLQKFELFMKAMKNPKPILYVFLSLLNPIHIRNQWGRSTQKVIIGLPWGIHSWGYWLEVIPDYLW